MLRKSLIDPEDPAVLGEFLSHCPMFADLEFLVDIFDNKYHDFFLVRKTCELLVHRVVTWLQAGN